MLEVQTKPFLNARILQLEQIDMTFKLLLTSFLFVVNAQQLLLRLPDECSVPKSPPTCAYSRERLYFKSCGIYNGGNCPRFCHALQAQYWAGQSSRYRCFKITPSLPGLKRIYESCMFRCTLAQKRIGQYRIDGVKNIGFNALQFGWKASNIKALIYISVNRNEYVTSRVLVYTSNILPFNYRDKNHSNSPSGPRPAPYNECTCSACSKHRASCPSCCRSSDSISV